MVKIRAYIKLYRNTVGRAFSSGYRPLFDFEGILKSGEIILTDRKIFTLGSEGFVTIIFPNPNYLKSDFIQGKSFYFGEALTRLGEGVIYEVFDNNNIDSLLDH